MYNNITKYFEGCFLWKTIILFVSYLLSSWALLVVLLLTIPL